MTHCVGGVMFVCVCRGGVVCVCVYALKRVVFCVYREGGLFACVGRRKGCLCVCDVSSSLSPPLSSSYNRLHTSP